jgi:hypothetical protein
MYVFRSFLTPFLSQYYTIPHITVRQMETGSSISVFSNQFIETFSPEKLSKIQENTYGGGSSLATYGVLSGGLIVALIGILAFIYINREMFSNIVKHYMLWFYLGKPNEIHVVVRTPDL